MPTKTNHECHKSFRKESSRIISIILFFFLAMDPLHPAFAVNSAQTFSDVDPSAWYADAAAYVYEHKIMVGTSANHFSPDLSVTRAMAVTVLYNMERQYAYTAQGESVDTRSFCDALDSSFNTTRSTTEIPSPKETTFAKIRPLQEPIYTDIPMLQEPIYTDIPMLQEPIYTDIPTLQEPIFTDIRPDAYYTEAVVWAAKTGIVSGFPDKSFRPDTPVSREQFAMMLSQMMQYDTSMGGTVYTDAPETRTSDVEVTDNTVSSAAIYLNTHFLDVSAISSYALSAVAMVSDQGWMAGFPSGEFRPCGTLTRAQLACVVKNFMKWQHLEMKTDQQAKKQADAEQTAIDQTDSKQTAIDQTDSKQTAIDQTDSKQTAINQAGSEQTAIKQTGSEQTATKQTGSEQTANNQTGSEQTATNHSAFHFENAEVYCDADGRVASISGTFIEKKIYNTEDAAELISACVDLLGFSLQPHSREISHNALQNAAGAENFYCYTPMVSGVPVLGSQIIIAASEDGTVTGLISSYDTRIETINTYPYLEEEEAITLAFEHIAAGTADINFQNSSQLEIISALRAVLASSARLVIRPGDETNSPMLVYQVKIYPLPDSGLLGAPDLFRTICVCAEGKSTGVIVSDCLSNPSASAKALSSDMVSCCDLTGSMQTLTVEPTGFLNLSFELHDASRQITSYRTIFFPGFGSAIPGELQVFSSPSKVPAAAVSVHGNLEQVYDYYAEILGRKSYRSTSPGSAFFGLTDGSAPIVASYGYAPIVASYDYAPSSAETCANAYWCSDYQQFLFGNSGNFAAGLDVVAHEYTHAVTQYSAGGGAGLIYEKESGALNESYSDIMGCLVEGKSTEGKWLIGEDCDETLRNLADPSQFGHPSCYSKRLTGAADNGGVHRNSLIFSHAAYLMMTDARTRSVTDETWAKLFYASLFRLPSDATFLLARRAVLNTAKAMKMEPAVIQTMKDAFSAVEIQEADVIRVSLQWGKLPADLDLRVRLPRIGLLDSTVTLWFRTKFYYNNGVLTDEKTGQKLAAELSDDATTGYGPETVSIYRKTPGDYVFTVIDYSHAEEPDSDALAESCAYVLVYLGGEDDAAALFTVPRNLQGSEWQVCTLHIDEKGNCSIR